MFGSRLVSKYLLAVAVGASTGGVISYGADHVRTAPAVAAMPSAGLEPAAKTSHFDDVFKSASDALR